MGASSQLLASMMFFSFETQTTYTTPRMSLFKASKNYGNKLMFLEVFFRVFYWVLAPANKPINILSKSAGRLANPPYSKA